MLGELEWRLPQRLDGTRRRSELVEMLAGLARRGELCVEEKGRQPPSAARTEELLARAVDGGLSRLAALALLID